MALGSGCATAQAATASKLSEVERQTLTVRFMGQPANKDELYVCGFVDDVFTCVLYKDLEKEMRP